MDWLESPRGRDFVSALFILLFLGLMVVVAHGQGLTGDTVYDNAVAALEGGDLAAAETGFRSILDNPLSHDSGTVELAHLGLLRVHRARDDLTAFETELGALETRNPSSPVIDDAILLYAQFTFDRGEYHFSASIAELFGEDPVLQTSEFGEEAALHVLRALHLGNDALLFDEAYDAFAAGFPASARMDEADLLRARIAQDVERRLWVAVERFESFLRDHSDSLLIPDARVALADARGWSGDWEGMRADFEAIAAELGTTHPDHAARGLLEQGLHALLVEQDGDAARGFFTQASAQFGDEEAGQEAAIYLRALDQPASMAQMALQREMGLRAMQIYENRVEGLLDHRAQVVASRCQEFQDFLSDPSVDDEEKAEQLYQIAYANHQTGHTREAWETAQRIIVDYPNTLHARVGARAILAICHVVSNQEAEALVLYRAIADELQPGDLDAGFVFRQLARMNTVLVDHDSVALGWAELLDRFPDDRFIGQARDHLDQLLTERPALTAQIEEQRADLTARGQLASVHIFDREPLRQALMAAVGPSGGTGVAGELPEPGPAADAMPAGESEPVAKAPPPDGVFPVPGGGEVGR